MLDKRQEAPFTEMILSVRPLMDDFAIVLGKRDDETLAILRAAGKQN